MAPDLRIDTRDRLRIREAERRGDAFLVLRDDDGSQQIVTLGMDRPAVVIGRSSDSDVAVGWDNRVSRTHARLDRVGTRWSVDDDGLSRNGTYVNEERVDRRSRLRDGDIIRVGHTTLVFRDPSRGSTQPTAPESRLAEPLPLSPGQRKVLAALCRPCQAAGGPHPPASNEVIADELCLSVDAVKAQLRALFRRFDIEDLPQIQKRTALVRLALASGVLRSGG